MALQIHPSLSSSLFKKTLPSSPSLDIKKTHQTQNQIKTSQVIQPHLIKNPPQSPLVEGLGRNHLQQQLQAKQVGVGVKKKRKRNRRGRASIAWRTPVEKPGFTRQEYEATFKEISRNENAFILAWLGLGGIILVEDLVLAASGMSRKKIKILVFEFC